MTEHSHIGATTSEPHAKDAWPASTARRTLYFCRTPLQALIVREIMARYPGPACVVYQAVTSSPKHKYYFDQISCPSKVFIPWEPLGVSDTLTDVVAWRKIPASIRRQQYSDLFISSLGSIPFSMLVRRNPSARVSTFDDGTFNVNPAIFPRFISEEPRLRKFAKHVLRGVSNIDLLEMGHRHYTIFNPKDLVGITYEIEEVDLLRTSQVKSKAASSFRRKVRVLLGTALPASAPREGYQRLVASQQFDIYLPHPAELSDPRLKPWVIEACPRLEPEKMIAEDVILELSRAGMMPVVYGFNSTALLTLRRLVPTFSIQMKQLFVQLPHALLRRSRVRLVHLTEEMSADRGPLHGIVNANDPSLRDVGTI